MKSENFKILLVEDNVDQAELITECIGQNNINCKIFHVIDGEEAVNFLSARDRFFDREEFPLPDIILLDLKIPKIDGIEVLKFIKNDSGLVSIPVIIFTSSMDEKDLQQAYLNHTNSYVVKPLGFNSLSSFVRMIFSYWNKFNIAPGKK